MFFVTGVDPLRTVAAVKIGIEDQAGDLLQHRHADLLRRPRIDGRFVDDGIAFFPHRADGSRGADQRLEIGAFRGIDRCRHRDDKDVAGGDRRRIGRVAQVRTGAKLVLADLEGRVPSRRQFGDAGGVEIETHCMEMFSKFNGQRQPDITEADDRNPCLFA